MFTGLIESVCEVRSLTPAPGAQGKCLEVVLGSRYTDVQIGDSIAVNGVCLTVTQLEKQTARFDVSPETLARTTLGDLQIGMQVNTERALQIGDRLGGHFVQGHVDGIATVRSLQTQGDFINITFRADKSLLEQLVLKGSVAVDGVSLTVAHLDSQSFSVAVIPQTAQVTTLYNKRSGVRVNIEIDLLVKAVRRTCLALFEKNPTLTVDKLRQMGF
ncbi:riboflavin synthase [Planctomycetota bacterium]